MSYLGDKCKNLKTIDISGCIMLTDEGILQLTQVSFGIVSTGDYGFGKEISGVRSARAFLFKGLKGLWYLAPQVSKDEVPGRGTAV